MAIFAPKPREQAGSGQGGLPFGKRLSTLGTSGRGWSQGGVPGGGPGGLGGRYCDSAALPEPEPSPPAAITALVPHAMASTTNRPTIDDLIGSPSDSGPA